MKNQKMMKMLCSVIMSACMTIAISLTGSNVALAAGGSSASDSSEADRKGTITYVYPPEGAGTDLYLVGEVTEEGYVLSDVFAAYGVNLNSKAAAATLAAYIERDRAAGSDEGNDSLKPYASTETGEDGKAVFTEVERGLYLVISESVKTTEGLYVPSAVLVPMPTTQDKMECWDQEIIDKYEVIPPEPDEKTSLKVQKIWKNDEEASRPESITVQLICDGEIVEGKEIVLDKYNNWAYTWKDLEGGHVWAAMEKEVPEGYSVANNNEGDTIVITNTWENANPPDSPDNPDNPDNPSGGGGNGGGGNGGGGGGKLPKTGQPWPYVLYMIVAGLFCILVGLLCRKNE